MSAITTDGVGSITKAAPVPPGAPPNKWEELFIFRMVKNENGKISFKADLATILQPFTRGTGRIHLKEMSVKCKANAKGHWINFGVAEVGSNLTAMGAAGKPNGFTWTANDRTVGDMVNYTIIPEDILSRQIRPQPADLPTIQVFLSAHPDMTIWLHIKTENYGLKVTHENLK